MINLQDYENTKEGISVHPLNSRLLQRKHMDASNIKQATWRLESAKATEAARLLCGKSSIAESWDGMILVRFGLWFMTFLVL